MKIFIISGLVGMFSIIAGGMLLGTSDFSQVKNKLSFLEQFDIQVEEKDDAAHISVQMGNTTPDKATTKIISTQGDDSMTLHIQTQDRSKRKFTEQHLAFEDRHIQEIEVLGLAANVEISGSSEAKNLTVELKCLQGYEEACQNLIKEEKGVLSIDGKRSREILSSRKNILKSIEIEYPERSEKKLQVNIGAGNIEIDEAVFSSIDLKMGAGNLDIDEVRATDIKIKNGAGKVSLEDVEVLGAIDIKNGTGDIEVETLNANPNVVVKTGTGSISFKTKNSIKDFKLKAKTGMGSVSLPPAAKSENGWSVYGSGQGTVELKTGVGSVKVK